MPNITPASVWKSLKQGNERFARGAAEHPTQDAARRGELVTGQAPTAVVFGCGDSRVPPEIVFDQGLGDIFVVRSAGQVIDAAVLGSIEFAVELLEVPLVVVLGHQACGGVGATVDAVEKGTTPPGFIRNLVEGIAPSVLTGKVEGLTTNAQFEARHAVEVGKLLVERSRLIADRVADGRCAIVGARYSLEDGLVEEHGTLGDLGE